MNGRLDDEQTHEATFTWFEKKRIMRCVEAAEQSRQNRQFIYRVVTTIGAIFLALSAVKSGLGDAWSWIKASLGVPK